MTRTLQQQPWLCSHSPVETAGLADQTAGILQNGGPCAMILFLQLSQSCIYVALPHENIIPGDMPVPPASATLLVACLPPAAPFVCPLPEDR
jgi:hypothetical protein